MTTLKAEGLQQDDTFLGGELWLNINGRQQ